MELNKIYLLFPSKDACVRFLEQIRWTNNPTCPKCGSGKFSLVKGAHAYHCNYCNRTFTVTTDTIFHKSKIDIQKWFYAIVDMLNPDSITTARELGKQISVTKDTAWVIQKKIKSDIISKPSLINSIDKFLIESNHG